MLTSGGDSVLVRSSIDLGHNLGLSVAAEGVEDPITLSAQAALVCDIVQGYHMALPMTSAALTDWLDGYAGQPVGPERSPADLG